MMKNRILKFISLRQLSSAKFAYEIGVLPSSISHILSGRNKPSFDFIEKILTKYPEINADWLLLGKGEMFKKVQQKTLFENEIAAPAAIIPEKQEGHNEIIKQGAVGSELELSPSGIEKIVIFYSNKTFKEYLPSE